MATTTRALREYLQGNLTDFAEGCGMPELVTASTLTSLVVALADLREEGTVLIPEVYLCDDLDATLKLLPVKETIAIGKQVQAPQAIAEALKKCAPLANAGWCIYIARSTDHYSFGLFRGSLNPISISVDQTLLSEPRQTLPLVMLTRTATGCVELRNHKGEIYSMLLNDKPASSPPPQAYTKELVALICKDVDDETREAFRTYLEKTIRTALNSCHGTIIAVVKGRNVPRFLSDGVVLQAPVDVASAVKEILETNSDDGAQHKLTAISTLVRGMISSDGITIFNKVGCLIGYNCFIASPNKVAGKVVIGGARTRAYEALKAKVGKQIEGVFMQSQDGWTKFHRS
jgi:hypothetical protein